MNFTLQSGEKVYFDDFGDPAATYELVNWQRSQAGKTVFMVVGNYDASLPNRRQFTINSMNITWAAGLQEVPDMLKCDNSHAFVSTNSSSMTAFLHFVFLISLIESTVCV